MSRSNTVYPDNAETDLHEGKYTNKIPDEGVPASTVQSSTLNLLLDNLEAALLAAGLVPDNTDAEQLKNALEHYASQATAARATLETPVRAAWQKFIKNT